MGLFDGMLKEGESLFKNEVALDFSFQPKLLLHREKEQFAIANTIKPLFQARSGKNILIHGKPGIGKTVAIKHIFNEIEENYDNVTPLYINCWKNNSTYKIAIEICDQIGYKFVQNKKTQDLFREINTRLNKTSVVFAFDEIDKVEEFDFLYTLLEEIYRKTIILISNYKEWIITLDERIKSRLAPDLLAFKEYNQEETKDILKNRMEFAFKPDVFSKEGFSIVATKAYESHDIRAGLHMMKEAGLIAEQESSRVITEKHVNLAIEKLDQLATKQNLELEEEEKFILNIIKLNTGKKIGELFKVYQENGGKASYKTFTRKIAKLKEGKFVSVKTLSGGAEGSTSIITFQSVKKLTDF